MTAEKKLSKAEQLWNDLKDKQVSVFGLPAKKLSDLTEFVNIDPDKLHLKVVGPTAVITAIDDSLNIIKNGGMETRAELFNLEQTKNGMLVITRNSSTS